MFIYYAMNIGLNVGAIIVAQYFNFTNNESNTIIVVAIISIIITFLTSRAQKRPKPSPNMPN